MSDHDLLIFFNMSNQFLAPGGLNAECVQVSDTNLVSRKPGASRELDMRPLQGLRSSEYSKLSFCNTIVVIGTHLLFLFFE